MRPSPARRKKAERFGRLGELVAEAYLRLKFYRVRARRVRTPAGEIDLVVRRGGMTVFVEVKIRSSNAGEAEAFAAVNRRRIINAAKHYLIRHPQLAAGDIRFDVIFLAPWRWPRHVRHAFEDGSF